MFFIRIHIYPSLLMFYFLVSFVNSVCFSVVCDMLTLTPFAILIIKLYGMMAVFLDWVLIVCNGVIAMKTCWKMMVKCWIYCQQERCFAEILMTNHHHHHLILQNISQQLRHRKDVHSNTWLYLYIVAFKLTSSMKKLYSTLKNLQLYASSALSRELKLKQSR